jgi:hypothetical protein
MSEAAKLLGLSLRDAFHQFIFGDPRVVALGKSLAQEQRWNEGPFKDGRYPGISFGFRWPLDLTPESLAYDLVVPFIIVIPGPPPPAPSTLMCQVADAVVGRLQILRDLLLSGDVAAYGTFERSGNFEAIHRLQWGRGDLFVDVESGDLLRWANKEFTVLWSGIALEVPDQNAASPPSRSESQSAIVRGQSGGSFHVNDMEHDGVRSSPTSVTGGALTPAFASIKAAVEALWPEGIPEGLQAQVRDRQINEWQRSHNVAVTSTRTIRRYLSA